MRKSEEMQGNSSELFEGSLDEWIASAQKRMTVQGLREATKRLQNGQRAVNDIDWRGPQNR